MKLDRDRVNGRARMDTEMNVLGSIMAVGFIHLLRNSQLFKVFPFERSNFVVPIRMLSNGKVSMKVLIIRTYYHLITDPEGILSTNGLYFVGS